MRILREELETESLRFSVKGNREMGCIWRVNGFQRDFFLG